jgi:hypothetical protein
LGIWLLSQYLNTAAKHDIQLVELGPGRGTLMDDILRVRSPVFYASYMSQMSFRPCHNYRILMHVSSMFTLSSQVQLFVLCSKTNFGHGIAEMAYDYTGTTRSMMSLQQMASTPC